MNQKAIAVRGTICALMGGVCWGFSGTMGQFLTVNKDIPTSWVITMRMLIAGVLLLGIVLVRERENFTAPWRERRDAVQLVIFAVLGLVTCQFTYLECISWSNSATGTALNYLGQMMVLFWVCLTTRRLPTRWELAAVVVAAVGVFFLATHGNVHTLVLSPQALFWGILGAAMVVVYNALPVKLLKKFGSFLVTGWGMLVGGTFLFFFSRFWTIPVEMDGAILFGILLIAVVGTAGAFSLYFQGVKDIGPVKTALLSCVELMAACILTCVWLKTPLVAQDFLGMGLIIVMAFLLTASGSENDKKAAEAAEKAAQTAE